jgi:hypothetical protein
MMAARKVNVMLDVDVICGVCRQDDAEASKSDAQVVEDALASFSLAEARARAR